MGETVCRVLVAFAAALEHAAHRARRHAPELLRCKAQIDDGGGEQALPVRLRAWLRPPRYAVACVVWAEAFRMATDTALWTAMNSANGTWRESSSPRSIMTNFSAAPCTCVSP